MNNSVLDFHAIGRRLRAVRKEQGISQQELADRCFISPSYLSHIESGNRNVALDTFALICKELHVSTDYILFDAIAPNDVSAQIIIERVKKSGNEAYQKYMRIMRALAGVADQL